MKQNQGTNLLDLFGREQLNDIQKRLARNTGLGFVTVDQQGKPMTEYTEFCDFCRHFREHETLQRNCQASDAAASVQASISGKHLIYMCPCGLMEIAIPILVDGTYLGGFLCGQARCPDPPENMLRMKAVTDAGLLEETRRSAEKDLKTLPVFAYSRFEDIADLAGLVITLLCENKINQVSREKELQRRLQRQDFVENHLQMLRESLAGNDYTALLLAGKDFTSALDVFTGDLPERMEILGRMAQILGSSLPGEEGVSCLKLFPLQQEHAGTRGSMENWMTQILDYLFRRRKTGEYSVLEPVFEYINQHIEEKLTLSLLVERCAVSQSYLSRLFRILFQISATDYIHFRKLQLAKQYMIRQKMSAGDVAIHLGYNEYTYFSKVFRKYEGITIQQWKASMT